MENLTTLSDAQLYRRAKDYGLHARQWLRKFEGLLPEVARRRLYKRRGCSSIHEFAAKLAGMSHEKTDRILQLAKNLEDKPALKNIFESGQASYSKIKIVAYIATPETDDAWAKKVLSMPKSALEVCVSAVRENTMQFNRQESVPGDTSLSENSTTEPQSMFTAAGSQITFPALPHTASLPAPFQSPSLHTLSLKINSQLESKLRLIKQKIEKQRGEALGFAEVLAELVKVYEKTGSEKTATKPQKIIQLCPQCIKNKANDMAEFGLTTRHIPREVRDIVRLRQNGACAWPNCTSPPEIFHHTRRFALQKNHDPDYIVHLCTSHERSAHAGMIHNEEEAPNEWKIKMPVEKSELLEASWLFQAPQSPIAKSRIDQKVNAHRREPIIAGMSP